MLAQSVNGEGTHREVNCLFLSIIQYIRGGSNMKELMAIMLDTGLKQGS